jgi:PAS domain-containing protein
MADTDADLALARSAGADSGAKNAGAAADDSESLAARAAELERAYESLIEDNVVPILITDYDGKVLRANAAATQPCPPPDRIPSWARGSRRD